MFVQVAGDSDQVRHSKTSSADFPKDQDSPKDQEPLSVIGNRRPPFIPRISTDDVMVNSAKRFKDTGNDGKNSSV